MLIAVLGVVAFGLSACGGGPASSGVASLGSTTSTSVPSNAASGKQSPYDKAVAYVTCMRTHGITDEPSPDNDGNIDIKALHPGPNSDLNPTDALYVAANKTCQHLLPNGGRITPAELHSDQTKSLKWSLCMRAHGLPNFPEPGSNGLISVHAIISAGVDGASPTFQAASHACEKYQPSGVHVPGGAGAS
jgi:hypothetical protein